MNLFARQPQRTQLHSSRWHGTQLQWAGLIINPGTHLSSPIICLQDIWLWMTLNSWPQEHPMESQYSKRSLVTTCRCLFPHHGLYQDTHACSWFPAEWHKDPGKSWPCGSAGVKERKLTPTGWLYFGREGERCCLPAPMAFPARLE